MSRKGIREKLGYVELLDLNGTHWIVANRKSRKKTVFFLGIGCFVFFLLLIPLTYSSYVSNSASHSSIKVAPWRYRLNGIGSDVVTFDLKDTIIDNDFSMTSVVPGTKGKIALEFDFSGTKVAVSYQISLASSNSPNHLKLYSDEEMTQEFTSIKNDILLKNIDKKIVENIYWKWDYTTDDETETWTNRDISVSFSVLAMQKVK